MTAAFPVWTAVAAWSAAGAYVSVTDVRRAVIPRRAVWAAGSAVAVLLGVAAVVQRDPLRFVWVIVAAAAVGAVFEVVYRRWPDKIGYGDIRLIILNSLVAGWWGFQWPWWALLAGSVAGWPAAVVGLVRTGRDATVRWAPGLVVGTAAIVGFLLWSRGPVG